MDEKASHSSSAIVLDFSRLLGFRHLGAFATGGALASVLGSTYNKLGEGPPTTPAVELASALGSICNKAGEDIRAS